jgi:hypothetical protein
MAYTMERSAGRQVEELSVLRWPNPQNSRVLYSGMISIALIEG